MDEKNQDSIGYAFKGKIMISSITILFSACFVIVAFHVYSRWCRRRRFTTSPATPPPAVLVSQGLDPHAVNSLPTFVFESRDQESPAECAVCLSEFEQGETGRILPECKHWFHVACIDAWLKSHRHCPLCRTRVKAQATDCTVVVSIQALELEVGGSGSGSSPAAESSKPIGGSQSEV